MSVNNNSRYVLMFTNTSYDGRSTCSISKLELKLYVQREEVKGTYKGRMMIFNPDASKSKLLYDQITMII